MHESALIAVDKVANKLRFYDLALRETKVLDSPEPCVHELASMTTGSSPSPVQRHRLSTIRLAASAAPWR